MAQLSFSQDATSGLWIATATVNGDFNVHVEREQSGYFGIDIKTTNASNSNYVNKHLAEQDLVIDVDFHGAVYPKYVRVVSNTQPTAAVSYIKEA